MENWTERSCVSASPRLHINIRDAKFLGAIDGGSREHFVVQYSSYSVFSPILADINDTSCPLVLGKHRGVASRYDGVRLVHHLCVITSSEGVAVVGFFC